MNGDFRCFTQDPHGFAAELGAAVDPDVTRFNPNYALAY